MDVHCKGKPLNTMPQQERCGCETAQKEFTLKKDSLSAGDIAHLDAIEKERAAAREGNTPGKTTSHASTYAEVPFHVAMIQQQQRRSGPTSWIERDTDILRKKFPLQAEPSAMSSPRPRSS